MDRVLYERAVEDGRRPKEDPGPCDWDDMTDAQVDAEPDKSRCPFHLKQRAAMLIAAFDRSTGGRNLN